MRGNEDSDWQSYWHGLACLFGWQMPGLAGRTWRRMCWRLSGAALTMFQLLTSAYSILLYHVNAVKANFESDSRARPIVDTQRNDEIARAEHMTKLSRCMNVGSHFQSVKSL
jgi:hypothetical protein